VAHATASAVAGVARFLLYDPRDEPSPARLAGSAVRARVNQAVLAPSVSAGGRMAQSYRHLVLQLALKDFKIRYTHSVLGYMWSILNPLIFTLVYYLVFSVFIRFDIPNYPGYLLLGIVLWNFFSEGTSSGVASLLAQGGIITKVALPRHVVVLAAVLNAMMTFAISLLILLVLLLVTGVPTGLALLSFPVLLLDLVMLTLGISLLLAPLHVRFRDVGYLWGVALQLGFWLTPIIYDVIMIPERWRWLVVYNPLARIMLYSRQVLIYAEWPDWVGVLKTSLLALSVLIVGWYAFQRLQLRVVEHY
jgi:ABC-type polysaccharide/polyol phosphate export permease